MVKEIGPRYCIVAYWGPRKESVADLAERFLHMLDDLSKIGSAFRQWLVIDPKGDRLLASPDASQMAAIVANGVRQDDDGEPTPQFGYGIVALNGPKRRPSNLAVHVHAGQTYPANYRVNTAFLYTEPLNEENAGFIEFHSMRAVLLALVSAWDATWCGVHPARLDDLLPPPRPRRPWFGLEWMTYISPRFASLVTPPISAITERVLGKGLLMSTTEERFSAENPRHLAVARDIETAMGPVNALPWPPDLEPEAPA